MRQSGESLAGRISHIDMTPLALDELPADSQDALWLRGGFPDSFLAPDDRGSLDWRRGWRSRARPSVATRICWWICCWSAGCSPTR